MNPTSIDFAANQPARWLFLYNARFLRWMVTPCILTLLLTAQFRLIAANAWGAAANLVLLSLPLAWFYVRWRIAGLLFWSHLHNHILSHGGKVASVETRLVWYSNASHWLERNGLTGAKSKRWLWSYQDRKKFARLYEAVGRRQQREQLPQPSFSDDVPPEIARQFIELRKRVEELGPMTEVMFYFKHRSFHLIHKSFCCAAVLITPIIWLDPDFEHLKQPAESHPVHQLIAYSATRTEIARSLVPRHRVNAVAEGGKKC